MLTTSLILQATALLSILAQAIPHSIPHVDVPTCHSGVNIILVRGTLERQGNSRLEPIAAAVKKKIPDSISSEVVYPADWFLERSIRIGVASTTQQITDYATACPDGKIVLMGYSQGALVIGNVLAGGGALLLDGEPSPPNDPLPESLASHVIAVILFGDPNRDINMGRNSDTNACSVSASFPRTDKIYEAIAPYAPRLLEYCAAGDPVCCATGTSLAAHVSYFTPANEDAVAQFAADKARGAFPVSVS